MVEVISTSMESVKNWLVDDFSSKLMMEVISQPQIMVSGKKIDFDAQVMELGQFAEQTHISLWNGLLVFKPKIEHVAQQIQDCSILLDVVQPFDEVLFTFQARLAFWGTQVQIRSEIGFVTRSQKGQVYRKYRVLSLLGT